jgi:sortase (surface protein transpeptidase)
MLKPAQMFLLFALGLGLLMFSALSLVWTYGPIVRVEVTYQYRHLLRDVFHTDSWQGLILPKLTVSFTREGKSAFSMEIPAIFVNEPIVFNVDPHDKDMYTVALKKGIAHAAGTDLPGYEGLGYYFAHSSEPDFVNQYNAVFYLLGKLNLNDEIILWYNDDHYRYRVRDKKNH